MGRVDISTFRNLRNNRHAIKYIFPICKGANVLLEDMLRIISLQINDDLRSTDPFEGAPLPDVTVCHAGGMEMMGSGIVMCAAGRLCRYTNIFRLSETRNNVTMKLGVATSTFNTYGCVVDEKPFDHVTKDAVVDNTEKYCGWTIQKSAPVMKKIMGINTFLERNVVKEGSITKDDLKASYFNNRVFCKSIRVTDFNPPFIQFDVSCISAFQMRRFVSDLAKDMNTYGHLVKLERIQHGPFTLEDALPSHQWSLGSIRRSSENTYDRWSVYYQKLKSQYREEQDVDENECY